MDSPQVADQLKLEIKKLRSKVIQSDEEILRGEKLKRELVETEAQREKLNQTIDSGRDRMCQLEEELKRLQARESEIRNLLLVARASNRRLIEDNSVLSRQQGTCESATLREREKATNLRQEVERLNVVVSERRRELAEERSQLQSVLEARDTLSAKLLTMEASLDNLRQQMVDARTDLATSQRRLAELKEAASRQVGSRLHLEAALESTREAHRVRVAEIKEEHAKAVKDLIELGESRVKNQRDLLARQLQAIQGLVISSERAVEERSELARQIGEEQMSILQREKEVWATARQRIRALEAETETVKAQLNVTRTRGDHEIAQLSNQVEGLEHELREAESVTSLGASTLGQTRVSRREAALSLNADKEALAAEHAMLLDEAAGLRGELIALSRDRPPTQGAPGSRRVSRTPSPPVSATASDGVDAKAEVNALVSSVEGVIAKASAMASSLETEVVCSACNMRVKEYAASIPEDGVPPPLLLVVPCGHPLCYNCWSAVETAGQCPACRKSIVRAVPNTGVIAISQHLQKHRARIAALVGVVGEAKSIQ
ncbi:hypothetical protein KIPB_000416 [Kipferlia bialata]|uniref:RING-type domain-containing protein n=1 Tax=Kipferlia bialata TaxID=797122 RepID=A0A391NU27_9EUKA|nr:hypothetical protein KIPB_000416 [Kipferlia bialata]|eukprot:g416.t1